MLLENKTNQKKCNPNLDGFSGVDRPVSAFEIMHIKIICAGEDSENFSISS